MSRHSLLEFFMYCFWQAASMRPMIALSFATTPSKQKEKMSQETHNQEKTRQNNFLFFFWKNNYQLTLDFYPVNQMTIT